MLALAAALLPAPMGPPADGRAWTISFQDEFNGSRLDPRKWEAPTLDRQGAQSRWQPDMVAVENGSLRLKVRRLETGEPRYICGGIRSRACQDDRGTMFEQRYGYFEVRAQLFAEPNTDAWFAFWMIAGDMSGSNDDSRLGTEIDIMETFEAREGGVSSAIHWGGYNDRLNSHAFGKTPIPGLDKRGWHTYGLLWTPEEYVFYVDGRETFRTNAKGLGSRPGRAKSQGTCQAPGYLKLTTEASKWPGATNGWDATGLVEDETRVDWVRVWTAPDLR
jgi:beta-glucanase (GH16 family)